MTVKGTILSGVPARYAQALFALAKEAGKVDEVGEDLEKLAALIDGSEELERFIASPLYDVAEQIAGLDALMDKLGLGDMATNFVRLVASNRRLAFLPDMIDAYRALVSDLRGEVTAEVTSAAKLTAAQSKKVATTLKKALGRDVQIENTVNQDIMGGLVVRVGSRMIDTSLKTRLNTLKTMLKGV